MSKHLKEFPDKREWNLFGFTLTRLCFDYQTTLLIATSQSTLTVIIETPFTLCRGSLSMVINDPQVAMLEMGALLHKPVSSLTAFRNGMLVIKFVEGMEIEVQKNEQYESWQTFGDGDVADIGMLCSPHEGSPWGG